MGQLPVSTAVCLPSGIDCDCSGVTAAVVMVMLIVMLGMGCLDPKESFAAEDGYDVCFSHRKTLNSFGVGWLNDDSGCLEHETPATRTNSSVLISSFLWCKTHPGLRPVTSCWGPESFFFSCQISQRNPKISACSLSHTRGN